MGLKNKLYLKNRNSQNLQFLGSAEKLNSISIRTESSKGDLNTQSDDIKGLLKQINDKLSNLEKLDNLEELVKKLEEQKGVLNKENNINKEAETTQTQRNLVNERLNQTQICCCNSCNIF
ncbi:EuAP1 APETALA-like MADS-box protein, putative (macronuclear) [Tetrahymena thermophila SB210]|uniref:EuAP1 APETALA-like MADS-box protein, putative n=1 Tax=Tetrahymena thermophila (strain SB210) TaxID=312017 RepID=I7M1H8_TETTS|nr:EuAP1 APETALA-like MADS-box protein, putative [Tetrahymena thermophila SB210]EAR96372.1 EuAP1 APETALA-like MADS-box protein, putative [Tetrahymena thermophila SB210]|eukprot:XP_001016617.1 EuAP1 APETALA-like MADS-box protein, putative [Tetrahymena thermophila SB210]